MIYPTSQRGDTIVEVLISIAVVAMVLAGAFASANRSLIGNQMAKERGEALRLTEQQLEQLKTTASTTAAGTGIFTGARYFCFDAGGTKDDLTTVANDAALDVFGNYIITPNVNCTFGPDGRYKLSITRDAANANSFRVMAKWDKANGQGQDEIRIMYRVYP